MEVNKVHYLNGFGNYLSSEAKLGALPAHQNSPQQPPLGLIAEQISGCSFTTLRNDNLHTWLYRIQPSVCQSEFTLYSKLEFITPPFKIPTPPTAMRWNPILPTDQNHDWLHSLTAWVGQGSPQQLTGAVVYHYNCNKDMTSFFCNADGELLILPQQGRLSVRTELGLLNVAPGELGLIPRGIKFQVLCTDKVALGYACENFGTPFKLPELGVIGANGLANARDFQIPSAAFEDCYDSCTLLQKFEGRCWQTTLSHSPLDVVAWHGNYVPYKYNFKHFNTINTVSFDHPDPSIFTVLTSPSHLAGTANLDLVIFPPRWIVANHTFRPPYYHRNVMSEFMGLIHGQYDAKSKGLVPGGASLHNRMTPHGPDTQVYQQASTQNLGPEYQQKGLAFMLESRLAWQVSDKAQHAPWLQTDYLACWQGFTRKFAQSQ